MAIRKFEVEVTKTVIVELDDSYLDEEFNEAFSDCFFDVDCLEDHAKHLSEMKTSDMFLTVPTKDGGYLNNYVEGYGSLDSINCIAVVEGTSVDCNEVKDK